jgi:hypothetical protein
VPVRCAAGIALFDAVPTLECLLMNGMSARRQ